MEEEKLKLVKSSSDESTPLTPTGSKRRREDGRLPVRHKLCYGLGALPFQLTNSVIGFYIAVFLLDTAQVSPASASAIIFSGRIWDAITDPLVGLVVMKTETRFGKLKPWMLFGALFAAVSYFFLWYVPEIDANTKLTAWYLIFYCGFQTFLSFYHMPYTTLTMYLSEKQSDRDSVTLYRMVCEILAAIVGNTIMGQSVAGFTRGFERPACLNGSFNNSDPVYLNREKTGYSVGALSMSVVLLMSAFTVLLGTTEKKITKKDLDDEYDFCAGVKKVMTFRAYVTLMLTFLFVMLGGMILQGNTALYFKYVMLENHEIYVIVILVSGFVLMPFWQLFLRRFGKKAAFYVGCLSGIPLLIALGVLPRGYSWALYLCCILAGNILSVIQLVPWSMLPDVIDDFLLKMGNTYETIFYSFFVMFMKFATGIALAVSTLSLGAAGYISAGCEQPQEVVLTLRLLLSAVPAGCFTIGLICLAFYPITEEMRKTNKATLESWRHREKGTESDSDFHSKDSKEEKHRITALKSSEQRVRTRSIRASSTSVM